MYAQLPMTLPVPVHPCLIGATRDAEVDQIGEIVLVNQDVGRFDVAMHQPHLVRGM